MNETGSDYRVRRGINNDNHKCNGMDDLLDSVLTRELTMQVKTVDRKLSTRAPQKNPKEMFNVIPAEAKGDISLTTPGSGGPGSCR